MGFLIQQLKETKITKIWTVCIKEVIPKRNSQKTSVTSTCVKTRKVNERTKVVEEIKLLIFFGKKATFNFFANDWMIEIIETFKNILKN